MCRFFFSLLNRKFSYFQKKNSNWKFNFVKKFEECFVTYHHTYIHCSINYTLAKYNVRFYVKIEAFLGNHLARFSYVYSSILLYVVWIRNLGYSSFLTWFVLLLFSLSMCIVLQETRIFDWLNQCEWIYRSRFNSQE